MGINKELENLEAKPQVRPLNGWPIQDSLKGRILF